MIVFFLNSSEIRVEGFGTEHVLNAAGENDIPLRNVRIEDETSVRMTVRTEDAEKLKAALGSRYRMEILNSSGLIPFARRSLKRKGLTAGALCFALILFAQQCFIAELRIEGSAAIPESEIAEILEKNGLYPGCPVWKIDEESLKDALYIAFPRLTWIGIDRKGALAVVETVSGEKKEDAPSDSLEPCDIIAVKSGYIKNVIVRHGAASVKEGDYVEKGDILISGALKTTNLTYDETRNDLVRYVRAEGDVTAVVIYKLETQFAKGRFSEKEMEKTAEKAIRKYIREKIPEKIEIVKKDLKFEEEENIIKCRITLEVSENIGCEKEIEFAGK